MPLYAPAADLRTLPPTVLSSQLCGFGAGGLSPTALFQLAPSHAVVISSDCVASPFTVESFIQQYVGGAGYDLELLPPTRRPALAPVLGDSISEVCHLHRGADVEYDNCTAPCLIAHHYLSLNGSLSSSHRDAGPVLALQLLGRKRWVFETAPGSDAWASATLSPGDAIWLPAHTLHATSVDDAPLSVHLTLERVGDEEDEAVWGNYWCWGEGSCDEAARHDCPCPAPKCAANDESEWDQG